MLLIKVLTDEGYEDVYDLTEFKGNIKDAEVVISEAYAQELLDPEEYLFDKYIYKVYISYKMHV